MIFLTCSVSAVNLPPTVRLLMLAVFVILNSGALIDRSTNKLPKTFSTFNRPTKTP